MKRSLATALLLLLSGAPLFAQSYLPVVEQPIPNVIVPLGATQKKVKFTGVFSLEGLTGPVVRFTTNAGNIDVAMLFDKAPNTVSTFLGYAYATGDNGTTSTGAANYTYDNTLIQRAAAKFVVQGGGFYIDSKGQINQIVARPNIASEAGVSNARGTLAMALSNGPDSATGDFFFNVADNNVANVPGKADLDDTSDGGPFTVFGKVVQGLSTLDGIEALPNRDLSKQLGGSFTAVPLVNYDGTSPVAESNLVNLINIAALPLLPNHTGMPGSLKLKVKGNTNPALVTSTIVDGKKLTLYFAPGISGSATITIAAKDAAKNKATTSFVVTVQ